MWPEHWHATLVFLAMQGQWRVTEPAPGHLRYHDLDYGALQPVLDEFANAPHAQPHPELMRQLRRLAQQCRELLNATA